MDNAPRKSSIPGNGAAGAEEGSWEAAECFRPPPSPPHGVEGPLSPPPPALAVGHVVVAVADHHRIERLLRPLDPIALGGSGVVTSVGWGPSHRQKDGPRWGTEPHPQEMIALSHPPGRYQGASFDLPAWIFNPTFLQMMPPTFRRSEGSWKGKKLQARADHRERTFFSCRISHAIPLPRVIQVCMPLIIVHPFHKKSDGPSIMHPNFIGN